MEGNGVPKLESESKSSKNWARSPLPNSTQYEMSTNTIVKTKISTRFEKNEQKLKNIFLKFESESIEKQSKVNKIVIPTKILRLNVPH